MPGDRIELIADDGGRIAAFVDALARFPSEPRWALVGGFAVNVRIERVHRLTNDIDTSPATRRSSSSYSSPSPMLTASTPPSSASPRARCPLTSM